MNQKDNNINEHPGQPVGTDGVMPDPVPVRQRRKWSPDFRKALSAFRRSQRRNGRPDGDEKKPVDERAERHFRLANIRLFGKPVVSTLDLYIIKKFLGTYIFAIMLILAITVMFDVNEKLDSFLKAPLKATIFEYFMNFLPYFANQFSPLFVFIAVIFFTSKLADNSEIIAILSSGMSFRRLLRPYMISATVIAIATFLLGAYIIPPANVKRIAYTNTYVKNRRVDYGDNIMLQVAPGEIAYMSRYDNTTKTGYRFSLDKFGKRGLESRLTAMSIRWDTLYQWQVRDYTIRDFHADREILKQGAVLDTVIPFEPRDFLISRNDQETLTSPQLKQYIERQRSRGVANIQAFEIEYHKRYAMCAAAFILTVIGMSLSSKKVKGGMGVNIGLGLVLSFSYILFMTVTSSFAVSGLTSPLVAMWIPNMLYAVIAVILYRKASR
ncbi:MAG: LptF/LptG family permease [Muribaculaceae bacterium]|nr:LptF/LptG family permease [Muribaculaceae bacterium]